MKVLKIKIGFIKTIEVLSDVELGRLFRGMLHYASSGAEPSLSGSEKILWPVVKEDLDDQLKAFSNRSAANLRNVTKRYESLRNSTNRTNSYEFVEQREESEKEDRPKETPKKKSSPPDPLVKENTPEKYPGEERGREDKHSARVRTPTEEAFETFWVAYPKKVGKKDAFRAFQKVPASDRPLLVPAVEMQKQSRQWQSEGGRFIPNPATWLNQGRWLDEGMDEVFRAPKKNRVAQELDDFYAMMGEWAEEQKAKEMGNDL